MRCVLCLFTSQLSPSAKLYCLMTQAVECKNLSNMNTSPTHTRYTTSHHPSLCPLVHRKTLAITDIGICTNNNNDMYGTFWNVPLCICPSKGKDVWCLCHCTTRINDPQDPFWKLSLSLHLSICRTTCKGSAWVSSWTQAQSACLPHSFHQYQIILLCYRGNGLLEGFYIQQRHDP